MVKRSRWRTGSITKSRLALSLVLIGLAIWLASSFLNVKDDSESGTSFLLTEDEASVSLIDDRGTIFDRNYRELAVTLDRVSVYAKVRDVNPEQVAEKLAPVLGVTPEVIKKQLESDAYRVWLAKNISQEEEEAVVSLKLDGISLHRERVRYYPEKESTAHVLGYVGKNIGLAGVEFKYNSLLNRYDAIEQAPGDDKKDDPEKLADDRKYLVLTLDLKIQKILEKFVNELGKKSNGGKFAALLLESSTGNIIGTGHYPSYDPNIFHEYNADELKNILSQPILIPHEIKKLLWDASLLQSRFENGDKQLPWSAHSTKRSLGSQLRLWDRLGLNDPHGVDYVTDVNDSVEFQFSRLDQTIIFDSLAETATPLHIVTAFNSLIMGGVKPVPHVIDRIASKEGDVFEVLPEAEKESVAEEVAKEVRKLLKEQMSQGPISSGILAAESLSYTEESNVRNYTQSRMLLSAIPQHDPKLVLFVFANLPVFSPSPAETKSRFGLIDATQRIILPMVALQEVMSNLTDMMSVKEETKMNFELHRKTHESVVLDGIDKEIIYQTMPNLKGLSLRKSLRVLKDLRLEIQLSGTGVVVEQKPRAGAQVRQGELCRLVLKPH